MRPVRTRYAPSPTGELHLGGLRTALFNFLYARKYDGAFILRVEDTDQSRLVVGAADRLQDTLLQHGLTMDESPRQGGPKGPYVQSERLSLYAPYVSQLLEQGKAYRCFCTADRLERQRKACLRQGLPTAYDRLCRSLSDSESKSRADNGESFVVRMAVPTDQSDVAFEDRIRGFLRVPTSSVDDQIIVKSDGFPTYHLASVLDDSLMDISHVIRGEEWLASTPKHVLLYSMLGLPQPIFVHLPLLLDARRRKLSKRLQTSGGAMAMTVEALREQGFKAQPLINFVSLLGWNSGTEKELYMSMEELVEDFSLSRVQKAPAVVDLDRLKWIAGQHLKAEAESRPEHLCAELREALCRRYPEAAAQLGSDQGSVLLQSILDDLKERSHSTEDMATKAGYYFEDVNLRDADHRPFLEGLIADEKMQEVLRRMHLLLTDLPESVYEDPDTLYNNLKAVSKSLHLTPRRTLLPLRYVLTGASSGASLGNVVSLLGRETCLRRLSAAIYVLADSTHKATVRLEEEP